MPNLNDKPDGIRHFGGTAMRLDYFEDIFNVWKSLPDYKRKNAHYVSRRFGISVKKAATDFIPQLYDRLSEETNEIIEIPAPSKKAISEMTKKEIEEELKGAGL